MCLKMVNSENYKTEPVRTFRRMPGKKNYKSFTCLLLLSIILSCTAFLGCKAYSHNAVEQQVTANPFLFIQKTSCLGTCPSYEASILTDGSVIYIGRRYVPITDTLRFFLPKADLVKLRQEVKNLDYSHWQRSYLTQWSDMPSTITAFYEDGKKVKQIKHQEGGPQELVEFQEMLHKLIMNLVEDKSKPVK